MTLIKREDALKPFCTAPDGTRIPEVNCDNFPVEFSVEFIKKHLLSLSSAEAEWIPCSERLPMMGEYVLTYRPTMGMSMIVDAYDGYYGEDDNEWYEGWIYGGDKVLAWMPLPKPYREDGE